MRKLFVIFGLVLLVGTAVTSFAQPVFRGYDNCGVPVWLDVAGFDMFGNPVVARVFPPPPPVQVFAPGPVFVPGPVWGGGHRGDDRRFDGGRGLDGGRGRDWRDGGYRHH